MKVSFFDRNRALLVEREANDPKIYSESRLFYLVKKELQKQGHDVIKKEMAKDGHLTSEGRYYIRDRKWKMFIYDHLSDIRPTYQPYNQDGRLDLIVNDK